LRSLSNSDPRFASRQSIYRNCASEPGISVLSRRRGMKRCLFIQRVAEPEVVCLQLRRIRAESVGRHAQKEQTRLLEAGLYFDGSIVAGRSSHSSNQTLMPAA